MFKFKKIFLLLLALMIASPVYPKKNKKNKRLPVNLEEPITVYSHGYMCNKWIGNIFHTSLKRPNRICKNAFIVGPMKSFNYADWCNPLSTHLGQDADIKRLHEACKDHKKVILVGVSRGASAIINYLATYQPTNIMAAIIESPFDHFENIADNFLIVHGFKKLETIKNRLRPILFHNYHKEGLQPIHSAPKVSHSIPLLIISSAQDKLIPESSTANVFNAIKKAGHPNVYLLRCAYGRHGRILWSKDGQMFRDVVHAFYKHHGAPYHEPWADAGNIKFKEIVEFTNISETESNLDISLFTQKIYQNLRLESKSFNKNLTSGL